MAIAKGLFVLVCLLTCLASIPSVNGTAFFGGTLSPLPNRTIGNDFGQRMQNLTSRLVSGFELNILTQLRQFLSERGQNLTLGNGFEQLIQNATEYLFSQLQTGIQNELQKYIVETINNTFPPFLAQILLSPELNNVVNDFLSSPEVTGLIRSIFTGSTTGVGINFNGTTRNDSQTAVVVILYQAFRNAVRENRPELIQTFTDAFPNMAGIVETLQQLFFSGNYVNSSATEDEMRTAFLSTLAASDVVSLPQTEVIQELLTNSSAFQTALIQALAGASTGNLTDLVANLNVSEILETLSSSNLSTSLNAVLGTLQSSPALQEFMTIISTLVESYVSSALKDNGVSEVCQDGLQKSVEGLLSQQLWAFKMIDAAGKVSSNLVDTLGQWKFLGSYDECVGITATGTDDGEPVEYFEGKYCRISFRVPAFPDVPGEEYPLVMGACVPNTCNTPDIDGLFKSAGSLSNVTLPFILEIQCEDERRLETDAMIVICILVVLGVFIIIGTLYDVLVVQLGLGESKHDSAQFADGFTNQGYVITDGETIERIKKMNALNSNEIIGQFENGKNLDTLSDLMNEKTAGSSLEEGIPDAYKTVSDDKEKTIERNDKAIDTPTLLKISGTQAKIQRTVLEQILLSFSVYSNGVKILGTAQGSDTLGAVNGVRFLSMAWIILGHTYYFSLGYNDNLLYHYLAKMNEWTFMSIAYETVSVDSFFAMSGLLVAYLTLKELKKVKGARNFNWLLFYFHRFWRLTPPYMLVIMVGTVLLPYIATGPMWSFEGDLPFMENCRTNWWTNLLYINNLVKSKETCMGWSWYLANDMQFYVISPLILLPLFYHAAAGIGSCFVFLAGTVTAAAVITYKHEYHVQSSLPDAPLPKDGDYGYNLYFPCYTRMGPYIIGLFTGYLLYRWQRQCRIPKLVNLLLWVLSIGICCAVVFGPYSYKDNHILTLGESVAFQALHRTGWGVALCWMLFSCACGYGGWINQILSWRAFIPLGRMTYCAYLVHPLVMSVFLNSRRQPTYFNDYEVVYMFFGHIVAAYGVAFVVSLAFESPMMGLEKVLIRKKRN